MSKEKKATTTGSEEMVVVVWAAGGWERVQCRPRTGCRLLSNLVGRAGKCGACHWQEQGNPSQAECWCLPARSA